MCLTSRLKKGNVDMTQTSVVTIEVVDMLGKIRLRNSATLPAGMSVNKMNLAGLASGNYMLKISSAKAVISFKIIKE